VSAGSNQDGNLAGICADSGCAGSPGDDADRLRPR
jgi:hypothetical protein